MAPLIVRTSNRSRQARAGGHGPRAATQPQHLGHRFPANTPFIYFCGEVAIPTVAGPRPLPARITAGYVKLQQPLERDLRRRDTEAGGRLVDHRAR